MKRGAACVRGRKRRALKIDEIVKLTFYISEFLKERLFGLSNPQGNHGESVKEAHFHLDNTPTVGDSWSTSLHTMDCN